MAYTEKYYQGVIHATIVAKAGSELRFGRFMENDVKMLSNILITDIQQLEGPYDYHKIAVSDQHLYFDSISDEVIKIQRKSTDQIHELYGSIHDVSIILIRPRKEISSAVKDDFYLDLNHPKNKNLYHITRNGDFLFLRFWGDVYFTIRDTIPENIPETLPLQHEITEGKIEDSSVEYESEPDQQPSLPAAPTQSNNPGCFRWVAWLFWGLLLAVVINYLINNFPGFIDLLKTLLPFIILFSILWFVIRFLRSGVGLVLGTLLILLSLVYLYSLFAKNSREGKKDDDNKPVVERTKDTENEKTNFRTDTSSTDGKSGDSIIIVHHREWNDYDSRFFSTDLKIKQSAYFSNKRNREKYEPNPGRNDLDYWNDIYQRLIADSQINFDLIYAAFDSIRLAGHLDNTEFAAMVVTCIQDITYNFIVEQSCEKFIRENPQDREIYDQTGCMGEVKFGVQSPVEFMYNLRGDCDTRSLLLYMVLAHYKYHVALLLSRAYAHAMLGIQIPATGSYLSNAGLKYYVWETTAYGCKPGQIAPIWSNMKNWNICLLSK